jgi:hypothetical protein
MFQFFKIDRLLRLAAAVCVVLMFCAPFAAAYVACWLDLVASTYADRTV